MKLIRTHRDSPATTEQSATKAPQLAPWKILIVDDEEDIHRVTRLNIKDLLYRGRRVTFLSAYSVDDAKQLLQQHHDIAVAIIDVVMESNDAGLQLVDYIRDTLENLLLRIIIRTGQPGIAPERVVIDHYDIDDYRNKSELSSQHLYTSVRTALKGYHDVLMLKEMAYHDPLTNLPNRRLLDDRLHQTYYLSQRNHGCFAILALDLDYFKQVNDTLGHDYGDLLLIHVTQRLQQHIRASDTLARTGGDEFMVILPGVECRQDFSPIMQKMIDTVAEPFSLQQQQCQIGLSIGAVIYTGGKESLEELLKSADDALYAAKRGGRNRYVIHQPHN